MSRLVRLESLIKREVSDVLTRRMPHREVGLVSITRVKLAKDMTMVSIFYSQLGSDEEKQNTRRILSQASGFIKGEVGRAMRTHTIPTFRFVYDDSLAKGAQMVNRINEIIQDDHED